LKANKVNLFVSSVLCVFWYHSPNILDTLHICNISWLRVKDIQVRDKHITVHTLIFEINESNLTIESYGMLHVVTLRAQF
jgi:hypothetical protein